VQKLESNNRARILLLGGSEKARRATAHALKQGRYVTQEAALGPNLFRVLGEQNFDAALFCPGDSPDSILTWIRSLGERFDSLPVFVMLPPESLAMISQCLKAGAEDYVIYPVNMEELKARLGRVLEKGDLSSRIAWFQDELSKKSQYRKPEVRSPAMRTALDRAIRVAPMRSNVLITGESGVGKELVARAIHLNSPRRDSPFIALNCAAMPANLIESELFGHEKGAFTGAIAKNRGKFEIADKGTLFLDEIAEMDLGSQAKLLRVLEEREFMRIGGDRTLKVDVRMIAATNADLDKMVLERSFRRDLYYRLKVVVIPVPPLRNRQQDFPYLVETFLEQLSRSNAVPKKEIAAETLTILQSYHWPGNVRELKNVLESILVSTHGETIMPEDLPSMLLKKETATASLGIRPGFTLEEMEKELIRLTLEHTGGNRTHSATLLNIGVRTLQRKIQTYDIHIAPKRRRPRKRVSAT
jgi:DNA-binding NtrC family response regulator